MCSLDHRGATGPMLMRHPNGLRLAYAGEETVTVGAGTFTTWHVRIGDDAARETRDEDSRNAPGPHPPYDLWCTPEGLIVKATVSGYMQTAYELVELQAY